MQEEEPNPEDNIKVSRMRNKQTNSTPVRFKIKVTDVLNLR